MRIIVLQGVPASGKSTWAREFIKDKKDYVIVSRDAIREGRGDYWIPEQEDYISDTEEFQIRAAIKRNLNVIIDATNLNNKTQNKWIALADELECELEFKPFEIGYSEALKRDKLREENGGRAVGKKVMRQFFTRYYPDLLAKDMRYVDERIIKEPEWSLPKCIICDIDGTVALRMGRTPFDWSKVKEDKADKRMFQLLTTLYETSEYPNVDIIFFSGRTKTQECLDNTIDWLDEHVLFPYELHMRKDGDFRKDSIIKKELYEHHIKDQYDVLCVFDDRNQVVDMWRELGLLCCQVYYGDF